MEYKKWLKKSEEDLETAKYNLDGKKFDSGIFFLQQSAEKALKALYIKKFKQLLKIHDLFMLSKKLNAPLKIMNFCKDITPAYQYTRYPDMPEIEDIEEKSEEMLIKTKEILKWVKEKI